MPVSKEIKILKEVKLPEATISLREDGIVHVRYSENIIIDLDVQRRTVAVFDEITGGKLHPFIFDALEGATVTKEARDNAIAIEEEGPCGAVAIIADTLPYKILANFYVKINRPKRPYKVFTNFEEGVVWLKSLKI